MSSRGNTNVWAQAKRVLSKNASIPAASFSNFIEPLKLEEVGDSYYILTAPNQAILNGALKKYQATITKAFSEVTKNDYEVRIQLHLDKRKASDPYRDSNAPILLLKKYMEDNYDIVSNEFSGQKLVKLKADKHYTPLTKEFYSDLIFELKQDKRFSLTSREDISIVIDVIGKQKLNPIDKILEYYEPSYVASRDGDLLEKYCSYVSVDNQLNFTATVRKWLLRAIHQIMDKKFINEHLLVFQGGEGFGKSVWIKNLFPDWLDPYVELDVVDDPRHKDFIIKLSNKFMWYIDEWDNISSKIQKQIKLILSLTRGERRQSYAEFATVFHRITSFITACNSTAFLWEGKNRRFIIFTVSKMMDIDKLSRINKTKLWAQLYQEYKAIPDKKVLYWTLDEQKQIERNNQRYQVYSADTKKLLKYFSPLDPVKFDKSNPNHLFLTASEIIEHLQGIDTELAVKLSPDSIGRFLKNHNFSMKQTPWRKYYLEYHLTL